MNILGERFYFKKIPSLKTLIGATIGMAGIIIIFNNEIFNFSLTNGSPVGGSYSGSGVSAGMFNPTTAGSGTTSISYKVTSSNGCADSATFSILVNAKPTVSLSSVGGSIFAFIFYLKLIEKVGAGRAGYVGVVMPVLALLISTVFENLEWQKI